MLLTLVILVLLMLILLSMEYMYLVGPDKLLSDPCMDSAVSSLLALISREYAYLVIYARHNIVWLSQSHAENGSGDKPIRVCTAGM